jgi:hypothetical protein
MPWPSCRRGPELCGIDRGIVYIPVTRGASRRERLGKLAGHVSPRENSIRYHHMRCTYSRQVNLAVSRIAILARVFTLTPMKEISSCQPCGKNLYKRDRSIASRRFFSPFSRSSTRRAFATTTLPWFRQSHGVMLSINKEGFDFKSAAIYTAVAINCVSSVNRSRTFALGWSRVEGELFE